jgi:uncharacterized phage-associated protein
MKKIVFIIVALFIAIVTMAYLYFSGLSSEHKNSQHSLYAATANSSFIFSFENEQSILDILKSQDLLKEVIGVEKVSQLEAISDYLLKVPGLQKFVQDQSVYIALHPGPGQSISFLYSTQTNTDFTTEQLLQTLKSVDPLLKPAVEIINIALNDSTIFYLGIKENLLLLSTERNLVKAGLEVSKDQSGKFAEFIQSNSRIAKNSLAEVYINFETLPKLLKAVMPGKLSGELAPLNNQQAYAALVYNFSKEKVLLTGTSVPQSAASYYSIFSNAQSQQLSITNILPDNTSTYTAYAVTDHASFRKLLKQWFKEIMADKKVEHTISDINAKYRIDLEKILPPLFKEQFITFQLSTSERVGAVSLTNGDKLDQLLLELSEDYDEDIKQLKVGGLLYSFFGEAMQNFQRPYYTILDNYMVFANSPSALSSFLSKYKNNKLLINDNNYSNAMEQLPGTSNVNFYLDLHNASRIAQKTIYLPFFKHLNADSGLRNYSSIAYQLSSDNKKFLTTLLMVKKQDSIPLDSLANVK